LKNFYKKRLEKIEDSLKIISKNIDFIYEKSNFVFAKSLIIEIKAINTCQDFSENIAEEFEFKEDEFNLFEIVSDVTDSVLGSVSDLVGKFGFWCRFYPSTSLNSKKSI
jgi:hypothetical protein